MNNTLTLGDLACELKGISSTVSILKELVKPNPDALTGDSVPTEQSIEYAFFSIERALDRIAEDLNNRE